MFFFIEGGGEWHGKSHEICVEPERELIVSKEADYSVKRDLLQCGMPNRVDKCRGNARQRAVVS